MKIKLKKWNWGINKKYKNEKRDNTYCVSAGSADIYANLRPIVYLEKGIDLEETSTGSKVWNIK